jgi:hypothetical protein
MATAKIYGLVVEKMFTGQLDVTTDTLMCALLDSSYAPNQDVDEFWDDISAAEVTGTAYVAGGETLTTVVATYNPATNTLMIDCDDPAWIAATITGIRYAVFYKDTGSAATSPLICFMDFITDQDVTTANLSIAIPVTGLIQATVA